MFSYNDGRIHSSVEAIVGGKHRIDFERLGSTTLFVAPPRDIQRYRNCALSYTLLVDGKPVNSLHLTSMADSTTELQKSSWNDTTYIHIKSRSMASGGPTRLVYVIPGNPGLCEFYADFLISLSDEMPDAIICAVSHRGFSIDEPSENAPIFLLDEQVQHKLDFLHYFHQKTGPHLPVYVAGHSVGAWMAQRIACRRPEVKFVALIAPTIKDIALSERGKIVTMITQYVGATTVWAAVWAFKWVPFYQLVVMQILRRIMPIQEVNGMARDATLGIALSPQICRQIVGLAIEEMQRIGADLEPKDIRGFWSSQDRRLWACFAESDYWVPDEARDEIVELSRRLPHMRTTTLPVAHSFVLADSEAVAAALAEQISGKP